MKEEKDDNVQHDYVSFGLMRSLICSSKTGPVIKRKYKGHQPVEAGLIFILQETNEKGAFLSKIWRRIYRVLKAEISAGTAQ